MTLYTETLLQSLDRVMRLLRRSPHGHVSRGTHRILHLLHENKVLSTRELAHRLDIRPSSLNETLSRMEQNHLVLRERDTQDQRVFLVRLSPDGEKYWKEARETRLRAQEAHLEKILTPEETETLAALIRKLADGLETPAEQTTNTEQNREPTVGKAEAPQTIQPKEEMP